MIYILNPGDGRDVQTFEDRDAAVLAVIEAPEPFAVLYSFARGRWRKYEGNGRWFDTNRDNLAVKVLEAATSSLRDKP